MQGGAGVPVGGLGAADPFMTGIAGNVLQQSSETYFRRGRAFVQSRMGFLSTSALHYYFNVSSDYGAHHPVCCDPKVLQTRVIFSKANVQDWWLVIHHFSMIMLMPLVCILACKAIAC